MVTSEPDTARHPGRTIEPEQGRPPRRLRRTATKVPDATVAFWMTKGLTTGMGESASDYFVHRFPPAAAVRGMALRPRSRCSSGARRHMPWIYWLAVAMVGVFGTMAADILHVGLGVPYFVSTTFFAVVLAIVFAVWFVTERTLSIHDIDSWRREAFHWAAVVTTFALGTAAGDVTAVTLHLGYFESGAMFAGLIAVRTVAYAWLGVNAVVALWITYVLTRTLGASFADWIGVPHARGRLDVGADRVSMIAAILIAGLVVYLTLVHGDADSTVDRKAIRVRAPSTARATMRSDS